MSQGVYVLGDKCPGGKCPGGKCPWGKCPRTILFMQSVESWLGFPHL